MIGAALQENVGGEWGEARNRSNNGSVVTLDSWCQACWYKAKIWNWGPRHTIEGRYYYNP